MALLKPQPTTRPRGDSVSSDSSFRSAISFHSDTSYQSASSFVAVGFAEAVEPPGFATSPGNNGPTTHGRRNSTTSPSSTDSGVYMSSGTPLHSDNTAGPSNSNPSSSIPSASSTSSVHLHHTESTNSNPSADSDSPSVSTTSSTTKDDAGNQQSRNEGAHSD
ncbi:hypothetical protein CI102_1678 [Trichoderma harzianum]|uniref:Uncharacterized protein n=1 Tax=Trichoderma harzianum CBS 226.95 TaxID=983964 RepID=A0A2T4A2P9_TRIHA|nr:hypothetical protein M431DRAFT_485190 [Trichoderma harzianum CBS 226.95]PKK53016.1 hypothetical protein CI102_1678 [Trichoderma harzianum]PTB51342.1 hypothetical protein M431DRAFT_485190 [Trichoderma harzianum CBS 226.95]